MRLAEHYESWLEARSGHLEPTTIAKYARAWRLDVEPALGSIPLNRINRDDVRAMVERVKARSPWQAAEALKLARMLLNRAVDADAIATNPAARVPAPEARRKPVRILEPQEVFAIVDVLPERWRALVMLDAYAALRWSEVVALKRDDLDLDGRTVRVDERLVEVEGAFHWGATKTADSDRVVHLPDLLVPVLAAHLLRRPPLRGTEDGNLEGLIFYGERGGPVRRHVFRKAWRAACAEAGVEGVRPEWLRHSGASLAYAATKDMKLVASRLGHTSTRMVDTVYVELYEDAGRAVADAIDALVRKVVG